MNFKVLVPVQEVIAGNMYNLEAYKASAESFMCSLVPESPGQHIEYTPGGLLYKPGGSQLQHATTISFLLLVYAQYLSRSSLSLNCGSLSVPPDHLRRLAKKQVTPLCSDFGCSPIFLMSHLNRTIYIYSN